MPSPWTVLGVPVDSLAAAAGDPPFGTELSPAALRAAGLIGRLLRDGRRPLVTGGCCSILMGAVPAARDVLGRIGLVYVDGHLDAYDNRSSPTGEAADMPVAALLGIGWPDLLAAMGPTPAAAGLAHAAQRSQMRQPATHDPRGSAQRSRLNTSGAAR